MEEQGRGRRCTSSPLSERATSVPAGGARGDDDKATWLAGAVADEATGARAEANNRVGGRG